MQKNRWFPAGLILLLLLLGAAALWGLRIIGGGIPVTGAAAAAGTPAAGLTPAGTDPASEVGRQLVTSIPAAAGTLAAQIVPTQAQQAVVLAVGDIGTCSRENDDKVAALAASLKAPVLLLGDNVYENGTSKEYTSCFDPAWGSFKDQLKPSPGNHEYNTSGAAGYYQYFGAAAGDPAKGYYSFDIGSWHVIALNSNCSDLQGGCQAGSPQETWLKADLAAHPARCTLAYWHHPRFSSGDHGNNTGVAPLWDTLYSAGVEIVLNGHDHDYERFAPQKPDGTPDPAAGIRQFVVGTGGKSLRSIGKPQANSELSDASTYGLLKLTLGDDGYTWQFLPAAGGTFTDSGQGVCH